MNCAGSIQRRAWTLLRPFLTVWLVGIAVPQCVLAQSELTQIAIDFPVLEFVSGRDEAQSQQLVINGAGIGKRVRDGSPVGLVSTCGLLLESASAINDNQVQLDVRVPAESSGSLGINYIRIAIADALSPWLPLAVDALPTQRANPNAVLQIGQLGLGSGQEAMPVAVAARIQGAQKMRVGFQARAGQVLGIETESARLLGQARVNLRLLDAGGKQLRWAQGSPQLGGDAQLEHEFSQTGEFILEFEDQLFKAPSATWVRLKLFPGGLPEENSWRAPDDAMPGSHVAMLSERPNSGTRFSAPQVQHPLWEEAGFAGPDSKVIADAVLPLEIRGDWSQTGERDVYEVNLPATAATYWVRCESEVAGRSDPVLRILAEDGRQLARSDDAGLATSAQLEYRKPAGQTKIRIEVSDLLGRAADGVGPRAYRLLLGSDSGSHFGASMPDPVRLEAECGGVASVTLQRNRYAGAVHLDWRLPKGVVVASSQVPVGVETWYVHLQSSNDCAMGPHLARVTAGDGRGYHVGVAAQAQPKANPAWVDQQLAVVVGPAAPFALTLVRIEPSKFLPGLYWARLEMVTEAPEPTAKIVIGMRTSVPVNKGDKDSLVTPILGIKDWVVTRTPQELVVPVWIPSRSWNQDTQILFAAYEVDGDPENAASQAKPGKEIRLTYSNILVLPQR